MRITLSDHYHSDIKARLLAGSYSHTKAYIQVTNPDDRTPIEGWEATKVAWELLEEMD